MTDSNTPPGNSPGVAGDDGLPANALSWRLDRLVVAVGRLSSWLWIGVLVVVLINVFSRYALSQGSIALEELSWHLFGIATMLTLGYAVVRDDHVRVDVLKEKFSLRAQAVIELTGIVVLALPVIYLMIDALVPYAWKAWIYQERSQAPSGLPYRYIFKSTLPLGLALVMLALFSRATRCTTLLFGFPRAVMPPVLFKMGVEPVWFAIMFAICLQTSFLTPPVGFSLFYIKGVCPPGITTRHIYLGVLPFIALQLLALALVFWFEPLATWLPNEVYGGS